MIGTIVTAIALQTAAPAAETEALGRRLAEAGTIAVLLPLMSARETEELVGAHPELSETERAELRATARGIAEAGADRVLAAEGRAYAAALSAADLRLLVAAAGSPAARRQRRALPGVIAATMKSVGAIDFKGETLAAFCAKTGKACPAK